jgi:site-specific DNA-methyltransferase (adenine-specific)
MSRIENMEIILGDSYQFLKEYQGELFCATVTDPPYGVGIKGMDGKEWDNGFPHPDYWREVLRHTEDGGWLVCFASSKSVHRSIIALEDAGWEIQDIMAWIRPYAIGKANGLKRGWEAIILGYKGSPRKLNIDMARICGEGLPQWPSQDLPDKNRALDFKRGHPKNRKDTRAPSSVVLAAEHEGLLGYYDRFFIVGRSPTHERGEYNTHPSVKPVSLMEHLLLLVNRPNGLILDPFAGSGSTLVAAKKLNIRCLGIEIDEDYYNITLRRLGSITPQMTFRQSGTYEAKQLPGL